MQEEIQKESKEIRKVDYFLYEFSIFFQNSIISLLACLRGNKKEGYSGYCWSLSNV